MLPRVPRAPFSPGSPGCPTSPREPISPTTPEGPLSPWTQTADHTDVNQLQQSLRGKSTFLCSLTAGSVQVNCPERETSPSGKQLKGQFGSSQEIMRGTCHCSCLEQWQVKNHYVLSRAVGMWRSAPVFCLWEQDLGCRRCFSPSCPDGLCSLVAQVFPLAPETHRMIAMSHWKKSQSSLHCSHFNNMSPRQQRMKSKDLLLLTQHHSFFFSSVSGEEMNIKCPHFTIQHICKNN